MRHDEDTDARHFSIMSTEEVYFNPNDSALFFSFFLTLCTSFQNFSRTDQTSENLPNPQSNMTSFKLYDSIFFSGEKLDF